MNGSKDQRINFKRDKNKLKSAEVGRGQNPPDIIITERLKEGKKNHYELNLIHNNQYRT